MEDFRSIRLNTLQVMERWANQGVRETPDGSNWGTVRYPGWETTVAEILHDIGLGPNPWCMAAIWSAHDEIGVGHLIPRTGLVQSYWNWAVAKGYAFRLGERTPEPGDEIVFEWDRSLGRGDILDHIGKVRRVVGATVYTVEGNAGNRMAYRSYSLYDRRIYGFVRFGLGEQQADPRQPGKPYVTKPYPLPVLVREVGKRFAVRLGKGGKVIGTGSKWQMTRLLREKRAYWRRRNLNRP